MHKSGNMLIRNLIGKRAQAFVQDMVIAVFILSMVIVIYLNFDINHALTGESEYNSLISEAKTISDYLVGTGYPSDWNETNVVRIGLADDNNVLDTLKISTFENMTKNDYDNTRNLLRTKYDYIIFFRDYNQNILNLTGEKFIGKPGVNITNIDSQNPKHLKKISRYVVKKDGSINVSAQIIEMVIYVWSEN